MNINFLEKANHTNRLTSPQEKKKKKGGISTLNKRVIRKQKKNKIFFFFFFFWEEVYLTRRVVPSLSQINFVLLQRNTHIYHSVNTYGNKSVHIDHFSIQRINDTGPNSVFYWKDRKPFEKNEQTTTSRPTLQFVSQCTLERVNGMETLSLKSYTCVVGGDVQDLYRI